VNLAVLSSLLAVACPASSPADGQPGLAGVARLPAATAMRLNGEGKQFYRQERWEAARDKYLAAFAADPQLLGALLNVACSYSRQRRYAEAAQAAVKLIRRSYVPWSREVEEAADLGVLRDHAGAMAQIQAARQEAAAAWGAAVRKGVLFVARTKPPVNLKGAGVLVLGLNQEIFAWLPETGRYLQVTAEDGRVLAYARSDDGQRVGYLLAGKVVRVSDREAGVLRGLSLRVLDLGTMTPGAAIPVAGDVARAALRFGKELRLDVTDAAGKASAWRVAEGGGLEPIADAGAKPPGPATVLTGRGVEPQPLRVRRGRCGFSLAAQLDAQRLWRVQVSPLQGKPFHLDARYGAGLTGLMFPGESPASSSPTAKPAAPHKE
jgi:tetratricopeptide (TPR) repeat protein